MDIVEISTTVGKESDAAALAKQLVDSRLAACVQIVGPIRSIYRWNDTVCDDVEWRLLIKTSARLVTAIEHELKNCHPYQEPEFLVTSVQHASTGYANWLQQQIDL
jgi:periplasmic divalent cation tolerance protein